MARKKYRFKIYGGRGDAILLTPTLKELKRREPECEIAVFGLKSYRTLFENNPSIDRYIELNTWTTTADFFRIAFRFDKSLYLNYGTLKPSIFCKGLHATEIIANMIDLNLTDPQAEICMTAAEDEKAKALLNQYKNPVLIQITSNCSSNQNWPMDRWEKLVDQMPDCTFLQVGTASEEVVKGSISLLGKTNMRESLSLLKHVGSFVGVDSFFNHASNAFLTKGVVLFGPSHPAMWGYSHNINLYTKLPCAPCIDVLGGNPCPYNSPCMDLIEVEHVKSAILSQLRL
ncbi:MAG: ADP-heptose:LPS heptosyltransferase [Crocinitomix sp.]|jgi:ADP-heptose:LPS heptosyltransferase